jgi:transcriptional regulator with XRE-family HTH domain
MSITGIKLRKWREEKGWSRKFLASRLGISPSGLWKYEQRRTAIPIYIALACEKLSQEVTELK